MSDLELMQDYARAQSQAAFKTLVDRHVNLVYSAALRQVRSPQLAEEISQSVFLELSRRAANFPNDQPVAAWLYVVTRRTAIDVIRRESRRLARETTAAEIAAMKTPSESWSKVEARLDEAMETLNETERSAIVLRFFENQSLREVGATLGLSEDTAQKRVSRALDRLRAFFATRGIAATTATLAIDLSAHAIQSAPSALGASIATTASTFSATAFATGKTIAMTTLQKATVAAALTLALGGGLYEATLFARQRTETLALQQHADALARQLQQSREQNALAAARLKTVEAQIDSAVARASTRLSSGDAALEAQIRQWLSNLDQLRSLFNQRPNQSIPELALVSEEAWFAAAKTAKLDSEENVRRTLSSIRKIAEERMFTKLSAALQAYLKNHEATLPDNLAQLSPFFFLNPIDPAWLDRYQLLSSGKFGNLSGGKTQSLISVRAPIDVEYDSFIQLEETTRGIGRGTSQAMSHNLSVAKRAFAAANPGQLAPTAAQLVPYLKWPVSETAVQKVLSPKPVAPAR